MPWVDRKSFPHRVHVKYDYHDADWYKGARQATDFYLTEPYFDKGGSDITMVSITKPFFAEDGQLLGVAGFPVSIRYISRPFGALRVGSRHVASPGGDHSFLRGHQRRHLFHPPSK